MLGSSWSLCSVITSLLLCAMLQVLRKGDDFKHITSVDAGIVNDVFCVRSESNGEIHCEPDGNLPVKDISRILPHQRRQWSLGAPFPGMKQRASNVPGLRRPQTWVCLLRHSTACLFTLVVYFIHSQTKTDKQRVVESVKAICTLKVTSLTACLESLLACMKATEELSAVLGSRLRRHAR